MSEKAIYVPKSSAKARQTPIGEVIRLSFKAEELAAFARQHANEKGYLNLEVTKRKEPGTYGDTHAVKLDTWQPKAKPDATGDTRPLTADEDVFF